MRLVSGLDKEASEYITANFPELTRVNPYRAHKALAIVTDDNVMVGAIGICLVNEFEGSISMCIEDWRAFPDRSMLRQLFAMIFTGPKPLHRVSCQIARGNKRARRIAEKIGFRVEGMKRLGYDTKQHAMLYGMLRAECPWLE